MDDKRAMAPVKKKKLKLARIPKKDLDAVSDLSASTTPIESHEKGMEGIKKPRIYRMREKTEEAAKEMMEKKRIQGEKKIRMRIKRMKSGY